MRPKSTRCFVAVDLPDEMRDPIRQIQKEIDLPSVRLVMADLVHITLKFLGDVPDSGLDGVVSALQTVTAEPFGCKIRGVGSFPKRSIRVVWIGAEGEFALLQGSIEKALCKLGFEREKRKFTAHATIARVRDPSSETTRVLSSKIERFADVELGEFFVYHFLLKKSTLTPGGPIYEDLAKFPLRASS
jgi:2'-5' RNA ligase